MDDSVKPEELLRNLHSLRIVTGQVLVQGNVDITDLRFLRSIEIIHGTHPVLSFGISDDQSYDLS